MLTRFTNVAKKNRQISSLNCGQIKIKLRNMQQYWSLPSLSSVSRRTRTEILHKIVRRKLHDFSTSWKLNGHDPSLALPGDFVKYLLNPSVLGLAVNLHAHVLILKPLVYCSGDMQSSCWKKKWCEILTKSKNKCNIQSYESVHINWCQGQLPWTLLDNDKYTHTSMTKIHQLCPRNRLVNKLNLKNNIHHDINLFCNLQTHPLLQQHAPGYIKLWNMQE